MDVMCETGFKKAVKNPVYEGKSQQSKYIDWYRSEMILKSSIDKLSDWSGIDEREYQIEREENLDTIPSKKHTGKKERNPIDFF